MVEILEHQGSCGGSCLLWSPVIDGRVIFILVLILLHSATCKSSSVSNCKNSLVHARFIEPLKVKICKYISIYRTTSESSNPQWMVGLAQRRSNPPNLLSAIHVSADGLQWDDVVRRVDRHIYGCSIGAHSPRQRRSWSIYSRTSVGWSEFRPYLRYKQHESEWAPAVKKTCLVHGMLRKLCSHLFMGTTTVHWENWVKNTQLSKWDPL